MTYKEFVKWFNQMAMKGYWKSHRDLGIWGLKMIHSVTYTLPWRREAMWRDIFESDAMKYIVGPIQDLEREAGDGK